jgi:hypothetical protein
MVVEKEMVERSVPRDAQPAHETESDGKAGEKKTAGKLDLPFVNPTALGIVLSEIEDQAGIEVTTHGKMPEKVSVMGGGITVETALEKICDACNLKWTRSEEGKGYELWNEQTYREEYLMPQTEQKIYTPLHADAEFFAEAVTKANLLTKGVGTILTDKRTNQVVVIDLPGVQARVQALFDLLDGAQVTRVFHIKNANIGELARKLEEYKSESGTLEVDEKLRLVSVKDTLTNIKRMESAVESLDKGLPRKVYSLNKQDLNEDGIARIEKQLQALTTKGAYYLIDEKRGLLILEDSEEVHKAVEKSLKISPRQGGAGTGAD